MNLRKSSIKRATALTAGALIGLAGAFTLAGPASAHAPEVTGSTTCLSDGAWTVQWTVGNDWNTPGTIASVATSTSTTAAASTGNSNQDQLGNIGRQGRNKGGYGNQGGGSDNTATDFAEATVDGLSGTVVAAYGKPPATGTTKQSESDERVTLKIQMTWADGASSTKSATVVKPAACAGPEQSASVPPPALDEPEPSASVSTPPAVEESESPSASPSPSESEDVFGEAQPIFEETCDSMTIGLDNPADGVEIPLVLEPSEGDKQTLVIAPGEKKSATFDASEGFFVKVSVEGFEDEAGTIDFEAPEDCDTSGSGAGDDEDELPLTGAAAGSIAAGAVVLLGAGVALFFVARRRKLKFTA